MSIFEEIDSKNEMRQNHSHGSGNIKEGVLHDFLYLRK